MPSLSDWRGWYNDGLPLSQSHKIEINTQNHSSWVLTEGGFYSFKHTHPEYLVSPEALSLYKGEMTMIGGLYMKSWEKATLPSTLTILTILPVLKHRQSGVVISLLPIGCFRYGVVLVTTGQRAGLLTVGSGGTLSSGSCVILIAGTNDVAEGGDKVIYEHLEGRLVNLLGSSSRIIVASLPHRHDLPPCHPINQHILLVNAYIEELCERHPRVDFFDFAGISRQHFTRLGMHLTFRGKKVFARLLLTCLRSDGGQKSTQAPRSLPPELDMLSPSPTDLQTPPPEASNLQTPSRQQKTHSLMTEIAHVFLGTPFQGDEQS
ncbi:hypothetical protein J6590_084235 [Homalodisca vitripennis]|nr:hypothetical protein J6590_084235 [Homalodisca vitripennis]